MAEKTSPRTILLDRSVATVIGLAFLWPLGAVAATEIALLGWTDLESLVSFASVVLAMQAVAAGSVLGLALATRAAVRAPG